MTKWLEMENLVKQFIRHRYFEIFNKKILIVGFGRIGKKLIKKCLGFDMQVYVYDPYVDERTIKSLGGKNNSIRKWFERCRYSINECTSEQRYKKYDCQ